MKKTDALHPALPWIRALTLGLLLTFAAEHVAAGQDPDTTTYDLIESEGLLNVVLGSMEAADFDGDGDLDLALTGATRTRAYARVFRFISEQEIPVTPNGVIIRAVYDDVGSFGPQVWLGTATWGDYDQDGDPDLLITGSRSLEPPYEPVTRLHENLSGSFRPDASRELRPVYDSMAAWGDYDNDGDPDLALAGHTGEERVLLVYHNDKGHLSTLGADLTGVASGSLDWGDYDGDGDLDLLATGTSDEGPVTTLYRNDRGSFTEVATGLPHLIKSSARWGDYDGDGDADILLTGSQYAPTLMQGLTRIYRNDDGTFVDAGVELPAVVGGSAQWGDYDGDGDLDVLVVGSEGPFSGRDPSTWIVENNAGQFGIAQQLGGMVLSRALWFDYLEDGDLDILIAGFTSDDAPQLFLFKRFNRDVAMP